ncbi:hypothetical protein Acr_08g0010040 [Actinidia rufa]|uniref:Uncharacterized protein n=1 Tax=Actinidia rufa TaxID=165716 RepID=A0A7J0F1N5_9ERIC|nr:hypothetical protein Acr_08g0010040 [Actinidia rufa]
MELNRAQHLVHDDAALAQFRSKHDIIDNVLIERPRANEVSINFARTVLATDTLMWREGLEFVSLTGTSSSTPATTPEPRAPVLSVGELRRQNKANSLEGELKNRIEELVVKRATLAEVKPGAAEELIVAHAMLDKTRGELSELQKIIHHGRRRSPQWLSQTPLKLYSSILLPGFDEDKYANCLIEEDEVVSGTEVEDAESKKELGAGVEDTPELGVRQLDDTSFAHALAKIYGLHAIDDISSSCLSSSTNSLALALGHLKLVLEQVLNNLALALGHLKLMLEQHPLSKLHQSHGCLGAHRGKVALFGCHLVSMKSLLDPRSGQTSPAWLSCRWSNQEYLVYLLDNANLPPDPILKIGMIWHISTTNCPSWGLLPWGLAFCSAACFGSSGADFTVLVVDLVERMFFTTIVALEVDWLGGATSRRAGLTLDDLSPTLGASISKLLASKTCLNSSILASKCLMVASLLSSLPLGSDRPGLCPEGPWTPFEHRPIAYSLLHQVFWARDGAMRKAVGVVLQQLSDGQVGECLDVPTAMSVDRLQLSACLYAPTAMSVSRQLT